MSIKHTFYVHCSKLRFIKSTFLLIHMLKEELVGLLSTRICITYLTNSIHLFLSVCILPVTLYIPEKS